MDTRKIDLGFIEEKYPEGAHICLIYKNEEERQKVINKYLIKGIESGEKVSYFGVSLTREELIEQLKEAGFQGNMENLHFYAAYDVYCPEGKFVPESMLNKLKKHYDQSKEEGFMTTRLSGEMHWALDGIEGSERLMEYESKVNIVLKTHPITAICQYDAQKFDQKTLAECLKVHPLMIVNGLLTENPFYIEPETYTESAKS